MAPHWDFDPWVSHLISSESLLSDWILWFWCFSFFLVVCQRLSSILLTFSPELAYLIVESPNFSIICNLGRLEFPKFLIYLFCFKTLSSLILMLNFYNLKSVGALQSWLLCSFDIIFYDSPKNKMSWLNLDIYALDLETAISEKCPSLF